jgi:hypothetical protein
MLASFCVPGDFSFLGVTTYRPHLIPPVLLQNGQNARQHTSDWHVASGERKGVGMPTMRSRSHLSPGCRDRLAVASSVATILALLVGVLALARAILNVTLPVEISGQGLIGTQIDESNTDLTSSMAVAAGADSHTRALAPPSTLAATLSPSLTVATQPPPVTATPTAVLSETTPITTQVAYSVTAAHLMQAPILLEPGPDAVLEGEVRFAWQWDGDPLPQGLAFDLLIWSEAEDQEHQGAGALGVIDPASGLEAGVDLNYVQSIMEHGAGLYYWTVIVVGVEPYERLGLWGEKRPFTYAPADTPSEPATQSP